MTDFFTYDTYNIMAFPLKIYTNTGFTHILTSQIPGPFNVKFKDLFNEFTKF